jgi:hypothetical protein
VKHRRSHHRFPFLSARPTPLRGAVPLPRCAVEERNSTILLLTRETGEVDQRASAR